MTGGVNGRNQLIAVYYSKCFMLLSLAYSRNISQRSEKQRREGVVKKKLMQKCQTGKTKYGLMKSCQCNPTMSQTGSSGTVYSKKFEVLQQCHHCLGHQTICNRRWVKRDSIQNKVHCNNSALNDNKSMDQRFGANVKSNDRIILSSLPKLVKTGIRKVKKCLKDKLCWDSLQGLRRLS